MELKLSNRKVYLLLFILTSIFYVSTLRNNLSLDDTYILKQIPQDKSILNTLSVFKERFDFEDYRPIPMFTFALEQSIFGNIVPAFSHGINLLLFYFICCILFLVVTELGSSRMTALFVTIVFLCHPIHANSVNNLKSRDTLMSCLFALMTIYFWMRSLKNEKEFNIRDIILSMFSYTIAIFCKLDSVTIILILPLIFILYRKQQSIKKSVLFLSGFLFIYLLLRSLLIDYLIPSQPDKSLGVLFMENPIVNNYTWSYQIGQAVMVLYKYIKFMLIPTGYYFYFGYNTIPLYKAEHIISLLLLLLHLSILSFSIYHLIKRKHVLASFGILFFYISLFYCSNLPTPVAGIIADRYAFIASIGYCITAGVLLMGFYNFGYSLLNKNKEKKKDLKKPKTAKPSALKQNLPVLFILFISLFYLPFVWQRNADWKDMLSLLEADLPHLKDSYEANRIATSVYLNHAKIAPKDSLKYFFGKGLEVANRADSIYPNEIFILESQGIANMGLGNTDKALDKFRKVNSMTDSSLVSNDLYGDYLLRHYKFDSAAICYYKTIRINPDDPEGYYKYVTAQLYNKRIDLALRFGDSIIQKRPNFYTGYECKGFSYLSIEDTVKASAAYLNAFDLGMRSKNIAELFRIYHLGKNNMFLAKRFAYYKNVSN